MSRYERWVACPRCGCRALCSFCQGQRGVPESWTAAYYMRFPLTIDSDTGKEIVMSLTSEAKALRENLIAMENE